MYEKKLNDQEIDLALNKIKKKYEKYGESYGGQYFSYSLFRERYGLFLKTRQPLEVFLFAEIQALEDRKNEIESKIQKRERIADAKAYLDRKEDELLAKIASYPSEEFHEDARLEIKKLLATLRILYPELQKISYDLSKEDKELFNLGLNCLKDFAMSPFSGNFARYFKELSAMRKNNSQIEASCQNLIREWGSAVNTFIKVFQKYEKIDNIKEFLVILQKISEDFRLEIFQPLTRNK